MCVMEVFLGESRVEYFGMYLLLISSYWGMDEWEMKFCLVGVFIILWLMGEVYCVCDGYYFFLEFVEVFVCVWCFYIVGEVEVDGMWMWMEDIRVNGGLMEG